MTRESDNIKPKDGMTACERGVKRTFDAIGAFVGLICTSPVFLVIAIAQKVEGEGPVFYRQERVGRHGKHFKIWKFRTMKVTAEDDGPQLAQEQDDRLTRVGRFLRLHHLDELPQLINVLTGDMSFVGYRPEREYFIKQIMELRPDYSDLYISRPGVTSNATLHNGYTDTMEKMIRRLDMDLEYLHTRNLMTDLSIIGETLGLVVGGKKI
ncbi:MAG: sugar transferase [Bacteroidaceae bacterium]|nr:sugar transferase [Bacteroidaceae bacterium]MBQ9176423.1 sugar transferase [Bacteroidaceae bacterium]